ncbi:MAG: M28 family peptidase [Planctomycetes bacterium]|nr:M28 family peptidase [Planctomycetota bacterium]
MVHKGPDKLRQSTGICTAGRASKAALLLICIALAAGTARASDAFERDCRALAGTHHRLTGTPEYEVAAEHVRKRLEQIGVDKLIVQEFPAAQTRTKRCELIVAGSPEPLKLLPMRPNGIIPPVTPPEGITGPLVYAGAGSAQDLANKNLRGAIAVLDYNAGRGWMRALRLGAKAVIFVRNGPAWAWHPHYVSVNANLPRFYYPGERGDLPIGPDHGPAAIHSEVVWEPVVGRNILAFLNGTDAVFDQEKEEMLILAAPLDSFGEVPQLSPGARGGANCAALLKLAELFKKRRPRRHVLFVFLDAQARGHNGGSVLYRALEEQANVNVEDRRKWLDAEREFLDDIEALLATDAPLDGAHERGGAVKQQLLTRLRNKAAERAYTVSKTIYALR